jgi:hypothetical protein
LAQEVEPDAEVFREELRRRDGGVGARGGTDAASDRFDRVGELFGRHPLRAALQGGRRQHGDPFPARRILRGARADEHDEVEQR